MMYMRPITSDELYHHGIKGMRWGVRRYQNSDGSLTDKGKARINKYGGEVRRNLERAKIDYKYAKKYGSDADVANKKKALKQAKQARKDAIKRATKEVGFYKNAQERGAYNRKRAAKYMVDGGMTKVAAIRKSKAVTKVKSILAATLISVGSLYLDYKLRQGHNYLEVNNAAVDAYSRSRGGLKEYSAGPTLGFKQVNNGKRVVDGLMRNGMI